jgi:MoaA/NifB/PqqE/SkfB family radical SAM enzyme
MNENFVEGSLTCLTPAVIERRITTEFPLVLNIEPTNACNAKCYYCPNGEVVMNQGVSFLDINDYKRIIDQIKSHKLIMLNFHKDGEPLLHKKLPDMVEYAKEKNAADVIHLNTNGILINNKVGRGIIERGIDDITVSIDAANKNTYQQLKGIDGFDKLEESIEKIINYRDKIKSNTNIRVKIMEFDEIGKDEIDAFFERWSDIADEVQVTGIQ